MMHRPREYVPLAPFTTFHIGGPARFFIEARSEEDIRGAIALARQHSLPLFMLGEGSNVLVPDAGVEGVVVKMSLQDIKSEEDDESLLIDAGAGAFWEEIVDEAIARGVFGIENLAGIPGSLGGAAVQNIGAYGAELSGTFEYADCIDSATGEKKRITREDAGFAYRTSLFKKHPELIITRVALRLRNESRANIAYADLARAQAGGVPLATPAEIAQAVRSIRSLKFPHSALEGTAGSFFKNPVISSEAFSELTQRFPDLPSFPEKGGGVKVSLAWLLDHALSLKGHTSGRVRLYEKQPLVIVAREGALSAEVEALANGVAERVYDATGITLEREVETFGARK